MVWTSIFIGLIKLFSENNKIIFWPKKLFFCRFYEFGLYKDDCYELRTYEVGVAQLVSAGAKNKAISFFIWIIIMNFS